LAGIKRFSTVNQRFWLTISPHADGIVIAGLYAPVGASDQSYLEMLS